MKRLVYELSNTLAKTCCKLNFPGKPLVKFYNISIITECYIIFGIYRFVGGLIILAIILIRSGQYNDI